MISIDKKVQSFVEICKSHQISDIVFSAGSRNAPLVISFNEDSYFNCISLIDERSASFYALGVAQQKQQPVIISCTSGSAALNYAPAIAEAYYQKIPLLVVTADRPPEWVDHGEGQAIRQSNVFNNYIEKSFDVPIGSDKNDLWLAERIFNEAINSAKSSSKPIHINFPFREPLYDVEPKAEQKSQLFISAQLGKFLSDDSLNKITSEWNHYSKILIVCGLATKNERLNYLLSEINKDNSVVVLTESTSNLSDSRFIDCIDRTLCRITENKKHLFQPELVITIGGPIISKKIKSFLRDTPCLKHWHVSPDEEIIDVFQALSLKIGCNAVELFNSLSKHIDYDKESNFKSIWLQEYLLAQDKHNAYTKTCEWSDLKAFHLLHDFLPEESNLHLSNSSPVRYMQLFDQIQSVHYNSNRGVSGIDGCTSTATGAASVNNKLTVLITGDLGFVYDINALWNKNLPKNLRIIVINNSGGGIFRIIPGPDSTNQLDDFFEVGNPANIEFLSKAYCVNYSKAESAEELENILPDFFSAQIEEPKLLEIFTPNKTNPKVLAAYFEFLSK